MDKICMFAPRLYHAIETMGFYFSSTGHKVVFATQDGGDEKTEHPWSLRRIQDANHTVRLTSDSPEHVDLLIADAFVDHKKYAADLARWSSASKQTAFLFPHDGTTVKRRAGHFLRLWPQSFKAKTSIFVGDRRMTADTASPAFQRRAFYLPYIHPQLFTEERLRRVFDDFSDVGSRPYSIGFIGNRNPPERGRDLKECQEAISKANAKVIWIDYGDDGHSNALSPEDYIDTLGEMDFCICPAGWDGNWTHRVIESICRGAIPILPDPHLYGLSLHDSVTCLIVENNWASTISRALCLPTSRIRQMRQNLREMRERLLIPSAVAKRFCQQF